MEVKKIIAGATIGLIAGGVAGFYVAPQHVVEVTKVVNHTVEVPVNVTKEVVVNKTVEVPVDNGNLSVVLQDIYDNNGDLTYITSDLKDDEVDQIVDRIVLVNELKKFAVDEVQSGIFNEVDRLRVHRNTLFKDSLNTLRINDDFNETPISAIDFDYKDATVKVTGNFEQNHVKYNFTADVIFKNDKFYEFDNVNVVEE